MEYFGLKLLLFIICISLITFSGAVAPAFKQHLDTIYGRAIAIFVVLGMMQYGGWPLGLLAAMTVLILMPATSQEGFSMEKKPTTDNNRWFIEKVMHERPEIIEKQNVLSLPTI
jgi:hypothetical protein